MVRAIVGANWGDEGKGKITDMLAEQAVMPDILLLMNMVSLHFIYFHQEYSISILHVL